MTDQKLLDVGCGTGPMIELLLKEFPDRNYIGIDLTPRMIEVAQEKIKDDDDKSEFIRIIEREIIYGRGILSDRRGQ